MEGLESSKLTLKAKLPNGGSLGGALSTKGASKGTLSASRNFSGELKARARLCGMLSTKGHLDGKLSGIVRYVEVPGKLTDAVVSSTNMDYIVTPPENVFGFGAVIVKGDADLIPENIKKNVEILGVMGMLEAEGGELASLTVRSGANDETRTPPAGYYGFGTVTIQGDEDLRPENIKSGVNILGVDGSYEGEGAILQEKELTPEYFPLEITPDPPNDGLGKVVLNADPKLLPENIKAGEKIFGVNGSFEGGELEADFHVISNYQQYTALPDEGFYGIKNIIVDTDPALTSRVLKVGTTAYGIKGSFGNFTTKEATITRNGTYDYTPGSYDGLDKVSVTVNVPTQVNEVKANLVDLYVTPGRDDKIYSREGVTDENEVHGYDYVRVYGDNDLQPGNIRKGVSIFGVAGSYEKTEVIELELESKTEYLTDFPFIVLPSTGKDAMRSVTIRSGDDDFKASNIKAGVEIFGVRGTYIGEEIRTQYKSVTPDHFPYYVEPDTPDYNGLHEVRINADPQLMSSNIRNGATIFGIKGTYESPMQELTLIPSIDGGSYGPGTGFKGISKVILEPVDIAKLGLTNLDEVKF